MRYVSIDSVSFTSLTGRTRPFKPLREIPQYGFARRRRITYERTIDEIAYAEFGEGGEADSYAIADFNAAKLVDAGFNLSRIDSLKIPQEESI